MSTSSAPPLATIPATSAGAKPELIRALGRWTLTALVVNTIIGSAVFALPGKVAALLGPAAPWGYVLAAGCAAVIVAVFAELGSRYRESGGQYLYARDALGRFAGIQVGWFFWLTRLTAAAAIANLFVDSLKEFWPDGSSPWVRVIIITALIGGFGVVNYRGVRAGAQLANIVTLAKLTPLALFIVTGLWLAARHQPAPLATSPTLGAWTDALLLLMFAYGGFESAMIPAAEAKNPRRDAPFALYAGLATVTLIYVSAHLICMWSVPDLASSTRPLADAARVFIGPVGAALITMGAMLSAFGWLTGSFVTAPRLTYSFAERGDFPRAFAAVHPRFRTPHVSIVFWAGLVFALAIYGNFYWNASLSAAARLVTYGATCAALLRLRRREPNADSWRAPGGQLLAVLGIGFCAFLATRLTGTQGTVMAAVAGVALINWLVVRARGLPVVAVKPA